VEMRTAVLEVAKLKPRLVDVEEYALRNACGLLYEQMPNKGHGNTVAIFELGARQTRLNVQHDRHTVYSREVAFGGQPLGDELVDLLGLGDAEQLTAQLRDGPNRAMAMDMALSVDSFCEQAAQQIDSTLQYYFSTEAEADSVDQILL